MAAIYARRSIALIAFTGFGLSLVSHGATFFGLNLSYTFPWIWGLHIGNIPLFFLFFISARTWQYDRRTAWKLLLAPWPRHAQIMIIAFFAYALVNVALFFYLSEGGRPAIRNGIYILHIHGSLIRELTEKEYQWQQAYILRLFSGHWMVLYLIPTLYFWYPRTSSITTGILET